MAAGLARCGMSVLRLWWAVKTAGPYALCGRPHREPPHPDCPRRRPSQPAGVAARQRCAAATAHRWILSSVTAMSSSALGTPTGAGGRAGTPGARPSASGSGAQTALSGRSAGRPATPTAAASRLGLPPSAGGGTVPASRSGSAAGGRPAGGAVSGAATPARRVTGTGAPGTLQTPGTPRPGATDAGGEARPAGEEGDAEAGTAGGVAARDEDKDKEKKKKKPDTRSMEEKIVDDTVHTMQALALYFTLIPVVLTVALREVYMLEGLATSLAVSGALALAHTGFWWFKLKRHAPAPAAMHTPGHACACMRCYAHPGHACARICCCVRPHPACARTCCHAQADHACAHTRCCAHPDHACARTCCRAHPAMHAPARAAVHTRPCMHPHVLPCIT
eukprot:355797-Chlamydomonas_euryale.AAC.3